jgi:hypothetical protein
VLQAIVINWGRKRHPCHPYGSCAVRRLTTLIAHTFVRRDIPSLPRPRPVTAIVHERLNRVLRRRLSDRVMDVFQEACISGDLDTAEELLVVIEAMYSRRQSSAGERRISDEDVVQASEELEGRKAERQSGSDEVSGTI